MALYRIMCKCSVQLQRHVEVHGVSVGLAHTHTRAPPPAWPRHVTSRLDSKGVWANVSASRVREATWARDFIYVYNILIRINLSNWAGLLSDISSWAGLGWIQLDNSKYKYQNEHGQNLIKYSN